MKHRVGCAEDHNDRWCHSREETLRDIWKRILCWFGKHQHEPWPSFDDEPRKVTCIYCGHWQIVAGLNWLLKDVYKPEKIARMLDKEVPFRKYLST